MFKMDAMNKWKEEREMNLPVPERLVAMGGGVQTMLQELVDALSVYAHLAPKDESREAVAMVLFQQWLEGEQKKQEGLRGLHRSMVTELLELARHSPKNAGALAASRQMIQVWWQGVARREGPMPVQELLLQRVQIRLSPDARMLEELFRITIDDFLLYFLSCVATEADNKHSALAWQKKSGPDFATGTGTRVLYSMRRAVSLLNSFLQTH